MLPSISLTQTCFKVSKRNKTSRSFGPQLTSKLSFDQGYNSKKPWRWKTSDMLWFILSICLRILKVIHKLIHLIKSSLYLCRNFSFRQRLPFVTTLALSVAIAFDAFMKPSVVVEAASIFLAMIMGTKHTSSTSDFVTKVFPLMTLVLAGVVAALHWCDKLL